MKQVQKTFFVAFDGSEFPTAAECKSFEELNVDKRLVGLTLEQVRAALSREDAELADAIERAGARIEKARIESGDLRRRRKANGDAAGESAAAAMQAAAE